MTTDKDVALIAAIDRHECAHREYFARFDLPMLELLYEIARGRLDEAEATGSKSIYAAACYALAVEIRARLEAEGEG